ncbi:MAG: hypothetical protein WB780_09150 [Candidatus Acidiferrales bacterium]
MLKHAVLIAAVVVVAVIALAVPSRPVSPTGSWLVDPRHSSVALTTDGTTDFGKTNMTVTIGFGRINGTVKIDNDVPANSTFDFHIYPATSMVPPIAEDGKFLSHWLSSLANQTLLCYHAKGFVRMPDGRVQVSGKLVLTRVDRTLDLTPSESYSGPNYGAPVIHHVEREATFVFDSLINSGSGKNDPGLQTWGSGTIAREDFPQLLRTVIATYWPPVVQDENCQVPMVSEAYSGAACTGMFLRTPSLPEAPHAGNEEDYPGPANFNTVVGNHLTIDMHLRLSQNEMHRRAGD